MPLAANLLPTASPLSCGLLLIFCTQSLSGPSREAVAANLEVLAPFEEQRLSLLIFPLDIAFLCENNEKSGPIWGPDSGPQTGTFFLAQAHLGARAQICPTFKGQGAMQGS